MIDLRMNVYPYSDEADSPFLRCRAKSDDVTPDEDFEPSVQEADEILKEP